MKETNMEHYRGEIEAIGYDFAIVDRKIVKCDSLCNGCELFDGEGARSCAANGIKWLMSPYKPESVLTAREKHFVEFVETGWLVRDKDAAISFYKSQRPVKVDVRWRPFNPEIFMPDCGDFPFITWEDEEPWAVEDLRKLKVEGGEADET